MNFGGFSRGFPGGFFCALFPHKNEEKKSGDKNPRKTSSGSKMKIREKSIQVPALSGVYTTLCQEEGMLLQKHCDRNGRCTAIFFRSIGLRGRFDPPDLNRGDLFKPFRFHRSSRQDLPPHPLGDRNSDHRFFPSQKLRPCSRSQKHWGRGRSMGVE